MKVRDKRAREAAASKKAWQSRVADLQTEEAALQREVDALAGASVLSSNCTGRWQGGRVIQHDVGKTLSRPILT